MDSLMVDFLDFHAAGESVRWPDGNPPAPSASSQGFTGEPGNIYHENNASGVVSPQVSANRQNLED